MKLALLSDLHANARALEACLAHAQAQGANQWALLGDLVGYGPEPEAVVAQCQRMAEAGATVLRGNHDAMAVTPPVPASRQGEFTARWTHERLSEADRQWLASLPLTVRLESVMVVHASVNEPEQWRYVEDEGSAARSLQAATDQYPEVRFVMGGHVHHQTLYYRGQGGNSCASHRFRAFPSRSPRTDAGSPPWDRWVNLAMVIRGLATPCWIWTDTS